MLVPGCPGTGSQVPGCPGTGFLVPGCPGTRLQVPGGPGTVLQVPGCPGTGLHVPGYPGAELHVPGCPEAGLNFPGCPGGVGPAPDVSRLSRLLWFLLLSLGVFFFIFFSSPAGVPSWKEKKSLPSRTSSFAISPGPRLDRCLEKPRHSVYRTCVLHSTAGLAGMVGTRDSQMV